jgi:CheY-like chemotaxis protein
MGIDGTGIGLSFSKQLVELMQGQIGVESRQGQGSCFWIELPVAKEPKELSKRPATLKPVAYRGGECTTDNCGKLLLAEDNLVNQEVAVDMLEQSGFEVDVANNGEEVLEALWEGRYSLVLMDCEMPVMDGFTATRKLREIENQNQLTETPVIALTAHAVEGVREKCIASGMNDFLAKPFSYEELTAKVSQWCRVSISPSGNEKFAGPEHSGGAEYAKEPDQQLVYESDNGHSDVSVLDLQALDRLRIRYKHRKKDLVKRVVTLYLEQTPELLEELGIARRNSDTEALVNIAHTLKSSSLTVGAIALADSCRKIEEMGVQGQVEDAIIDMIPQQYAAVEKDLQVILRNER